MEKIYEIVRIKQVVMGSQLDAFVVRSPDDLAEISYEYIGEDDREVFLVLCLNTKNGVTAVHRSHVGTLASCHVSARKIFKSCILNNSNSLAICHQHPSQNVMPSQADIDLTRTIQESGEILGIPLIDSVVIGEKRNGKVDYTSLKEKGYL